MSFSYNQEIGVFPTSEPTNTNGANPSSFYTSFNANKMNNMQSTHPMVQVPVGNMSNNANKKKGRRKIKIEFIEDKSKRHVTLSKRKAGIMKKAYELSTLTGTQCLLLIASETGHVYTFSTPKLQPLITRPEGKNLIQACLNASVPSQATEDEDSPGGQNYSTIEPPIDNEHEKMQAKQYISSAVDRHSAGAPTNNNNGGAGGASLPLQLPAGSSHLFTQQLQQMQAQYGNTPYSALLSSAAIFSAASQAAAQAGAPSPVGSPNVSQAPSGNGSPSMSGQPPSMMGNNPSNMQPMPYMWPQREQMHSINGE
jgi:hypothetical protein